MTNMNAGADTKPFFLPPRRSSLAAAPLPALAAVCAAASGIGAAAVLSDGAGGSIFTVILAVFAALGLFALLAFITGILNFGHRVSQQELGVRCLDASRDAIVFSDPDGAILFANEAYRKLTGHREGAFPGIDKMIPLWAGSAEKAFRLMRAARQGQGWTQEFTAGVPDWPVQCLRVTVTPLKDGQAGPRRLAWQISDLTADRQRQGELLSVAAAAKKGLERLGVGFVIVNRGGSIAHLNEPFASWLGLRGPGGEIRFHDLIFSKDGNDFNSLDFSDAPEGVREANVEFVRHDSTILPAKVIYTVAPLGGGEDGKLVALIFNQLEAPVSASEAHTAGLDFDKMFNASPIAMGIVTPAGGLEFANASLLSLLGVPARNRPQTVNLLDSVSAETRPAVSAAIEKAMSRKASLQPVSIGLAANPERMGRLYVCPVSPRRGGGRAAIVYGIDTSEQRSLEEQVTQSQKMQAVGQLAGGIAHDFNNLLTAIIGFSDLLLLTHRAGDPSFQNIMNIKQNANRAASLVRQLLAFSRRQTLRPSVLLLTNVVEDLNSLLGRLLGEKVKFRAVHGRDLWQVKADQSQLDQVIINLAVNARDAMPDGGELTIRTANISERESMRLTASGLTPGEYVLCEVSDTGHGIPQDILEKIFEPFFSTKEVGKGTGLGLSTVYGIVRQTGGHVTVESQPGAGAIFRIYLPRYVAPETPKEEAAPKLEKKEKARDLTGTGTVLLVEDEDAVRAFAKAALASRGYRVFEAANGADALEVMGEHASEIDLVVSDVVMPEMDGPALLKRLRQDDPSLKFILMSGYAEDAFRGTITGDEKFAFLPKPFSLKQLAAAVKETLSVPQ